MFVSIVVPNYNHSKYLPQRIDSILSQTYRDFELIILDDCSSDNSAEVINRYAKHEKVSHVVINKQNSGSTFIQWQKGFSLAKGELIWIAESDDYCDSSFLSELVPSFEKDANLAIAYCTSNIVDSEGQLCDYKDAAEKIPEKTFVGTYFIKRYMLTGNSIWNASAVVFRKQYALNVEKDYMSYVAAGDHLFWIRMAEIGSVRHISKKLNYFRQHNNKVTHTKFKDGTNFREERKIYDYIKNKKIISRFDESFVRFYFILRILRGNYWTPEVKKELLTLWGYKRWMKSFFLRLIVKAMALVRH